MIPENDRLFLDDNSHLETALLAQTNDAWKVLIIDDEEDVHQLTRFVLGDYSYQGKRLEFISAYSSEEAKTIYNQHNNLALILLDVVMETNDAGLRFVEYVRETQKNHLVRIVLRTGQAGYAPEKEVILKYDINDYRNKTELTDQRLFTVMTASLRSYSDIMTIETYRQGLEEKIAERTHELVKKNEVLIQLNREKDEFLSIAAHDLKNPLSAIQTLANFIKTSFDDFSKEQITKFVQAIEISSQRMFHLIKNLLDVNAIESGKVNLAPTRFDICFYLHASLDHYVTQAYVKEIQLQWLCSEGEYYVFADKAATLQVVENLISNSIKYSPRGKNVTLHFSQTAHYVRCTVQDQGPGLSATEHAKLFGKFVRLTPRPTGGEHSTGLGLFIVKKLVEAMNGHVWCETQLGQGATFIVELPRY
jgi:signal transduction histidine kinase